VIYVREPTVDERQALRRMMRQEVGRVSQRAPMVLLAADHPPVPEIARLFAVSRATVCFWLRRFDRHGPPGLSDQPRRGRPRKANEAIDAVIGCLITPDPAAHGYRATFWTVRMVILALVSPLGVQVGETTVRGALHRRGLRWGRPRLAMPHQVDPDKAAKQRAIVHAGVDAAPNTVIRYADESRVQLLPLLRALWHWVGQQRRIPPGDQSPPRRLRRVEPHDRPMNVPDSRAEEGTGLHRLPGTPPGEVSRRSDHPDRGQRQQPYRPPGERVVGRASAPAPALPAPALLPSEPGRTDWAPSQGDGRCEPVVRVDQHARRCGSSLLHRDDPPTKHSPGLEFEMFKELPATYLARLYPFWSTEHEKQGRLVLQRRF